MAAIKHSVWLSLAFALLTGFLSGASPANDRGAAIEAPQGRMLFVFTYRPGPAWEAGVPMKKQGLGPHGAYMQSLLEKGQLFAGGGFVGSDGGMAIIYAAGADEARAILSADPAVTSGIFVATIEHWKPRFHAAKPLL
jgi:uncharacterized protein YciI